MTLINDWILTLKTAITCLFLVITILRLVKVQCKSSVAFIIYKVYPKNLFALKFDGIHHDFHKLVVTVLKLYLPYDQPIFIT